MWKNDFALLSPIIRGFSTVFTHKNEILSRKLLGVTDKKATFCDCVKTALTSEAVTGSVKKDDSYENLNYKQDYTDKFKLGDAEVQYNEDGYIINSDFRITSRNIYGVTRMPRVNLLNIGSKPLGVEFKFIPAPALENEIKKVIRGYFFVR